jgi:eukaryotic-like serine/threonine-protein kinase
MRCSVLQEQTILPVGATIPHPAGDRYVIERLLGRGGFGAVYLVRDRHVKQRLFALKEVIDPSRRDHERFIFEAEVLKRLNHRALPHVYHVFVYEKLKRVYMLMDYIEGQDLEALLHEQPGRRFSLPLVLALMTPIVDALIYLHGQNPPIVHRDIKPANIIMQTKSGEAVLVDFGLAKEYVVDNTTNVIRHGSPGYAAPEQYGSGTNPRTDIYGLGATLYTLLTGTIPADAITRVTGSKRIDPLTPAYLVAPDVPWTVSMVIEQAMSISSEDRFATVEEFWQELTNPAPKQQVQPPPPQSFDIAEGELVHTPDRSKVQPPLPQSIDTPLPLTASEQELERITTITPGPLEQRPDIPHSRKWSVALAIFLALLFLAAMGTGLLLFIPRHDNSPPTQRVTPTLAPSTPQSKATATPTRTPVGPVYPAIATSYAGTVTDLLNSQHPQKTALFLTSIQQNGGNISGYFQGLGMTGPFKGSVTTDEKVNFTVSVQSGASTLSFEGSIKVGGDLTGSFKVLNQQGQPTGDYGDWNASSTS